MNVSQSLESLPDATGDSSDTESPVASGQNPQTLSDELWLAAEREVEPARLLGEELRGLTASLSVVQATSTNLVLNQYEQTLGRIAQLLAVPSLSLKERADILALYHKLEVSLRELKIQVLAWVAEAPASASRVTLD